jgi:hypothetical protein
VVLSTHAPELLKILLKPANNEGHFTQTQHMAFPTAPPQSLQVWSKSVFNEGHFTLEAETLFRPHIASYCSAVTKTS